MKRFVQLETGNITIESLLSSRTYFMNDVANRCVYCDRALVPSNRYIYFDSDNIEYEVSPTACVCKEAQEELKAKYLLLDTITGLDKKINSSAVNETVRKEKTKELEDIFSLYE